VQGKNVARPTDSRLLEVARSNPAQRAADTGIKLCQCYSHTDPRLNRQAGRYAHAQQHKGMRRNVLRGTLDGAINPILAAAGFNIRWISSSVLRLLHQGGANARSGLALAAAYGNVQGRLVTQSALFPRDRAWLGPLRDRDEAVSRPA